MKSNETGTGGSAGQGRGCLFYGCLTVAIVGVVLSLAGYFGARYLANRAALFAEEYTETAPAKLPRVEITQAEMDALERRLAEFEQAMNSGREVEPLVLTGRDLNVLIARNPDTAKWRDWLHLDIERDQIKGQVSLPLDEFLELPVISLLTKLMGVSRLKDRYLNGAAALSASLRHGSLQVTLESLEVKGQPLPENIMAQFRRENLAQEAQDNPDLARSIAKLERIEVADGKLTVTAAGTR